MAQQPDGVLLDPADIAFLRELKQAYLRGELRFTNQPQRKPKWQTHGAEFGKPTASIAATTAGSTVMSHGACTVWTFTNSTGDSIAATTETIEAYNPSTTAVTTDLVQFNRHIRTGLPIVVTGGGAAATSTDHKPLIRFTLSAALTTTEASESAVITNQYGTGLTNSATAITVHNLLTSLANTYVFSGSTGYAGLAIWDSSNNYRIIQMQCT